MHSPLLLLLLLLLLILLLLFLNTSLSSPYHHGYVLAVGIVIFDLVVHQYCMYSVYTVYTEGCTVCIFSLVVLHQSGEWSLKTPWRVSIVMWLENLHVSADMISVEVFLYIYILCVRVYVFVRVWVYFCRRK